MKADFDAAALTYEETFTFSAIGQLQRKQVHSHLSGLTAGIKSVLEINCGTGEDALWLANRGIEVTAMDVSANMIAIAKNKSDAVNFEQADINNLYGDFEGSKFDMVFSNFGGLNCLNPAELHLFFFNAYRLLPVKGKLVLVLMPKSTFWERFYFLAKADFKNAFRRRYGSAVANVSGEKVETFYYNPGEIGAMASDYFRQTALKPIGFFVPPSYLEPVFAKRPKGLSRLQRIDYKIRNWSFLSRFSDHYLIAFEK